MDSSKNQLQYSIGCSSGEFGALAWGDSGALAVSMLLLFASYRSGEKLKQEPLELLFLIINNDKLGDGYRRFHSVSIAVVCLWR
jgi:hypothetical protein